MDSFSRNVCLAAALASNQHEPAIETVRNSLEVGDTMAILPLLRILCIHIDNGPVELPFEDQRTLICTPQRVNNVLLGRHEAGLM